MSLERGASIVKNARRLVPEQYLNPALLKMAEIGYQMVDFQDPNLSLDRFALDSKGKVGVIILNHRSHADGGVVVEAVRRVNRRLDPPSKFLLPIAKSISTGDQHEEIQSFHSAQEAWLLEHNIELLELVRDKDRKQYNLPIDREAIKAYNQSIRPNRKIAIFPEGSVIAGRINPKTGNTYEMQEFEPAALSIVEKIDKAGLEAVLLNVGIEGTEHLFDNTKKPNDEPKGVTPEALLNLAPTLLGLGRKLAVVRVGNIYFLQDLKDAGVDLRDQRAVNRFVASKFEGLISDKAMGHYSPQRNAFIV